MNPVKIEPIVYQEVDEIIRKYTDEKTPLLAILQDISLKWGYLPRDVMGYVAQKLDIPAARIWGVATFYSFFETKPVGKYVVRVCKSAPCHVLGATNVLETLVRELGIQVGETSKDGKFTLQATSCLGVCGVSPAMMINNATYGNLCEERIREVLSQFA
ncbi:MAG TPA: NADH-quinone oxidoreductase subunit NuoE [Atribacteraceae bacterium]|nr:NADH-quinone oxidoreductase subunit NuoE [Atribacteraceae bacterium]